MGKRTKAARGSEPAAKAPKTTSAVASGQQETPLFCFRHADRASKNSWAFSVSNEHAGEVLTFLVEMAQLTWAEINAQMTSTKRKTHRKHHSMPLERLEVDAIKDVQRAKLDRTFGDEMFRFRLGGKLRLWGFRRGRVFHAVWWDHNHDVFPTDP